MRGSHGGMNRGGGGMMPRFGRGGRPFMERMPPPQMNHPRPRMDHGHRGGGGGMRNPMSNPRFRGGGPGPQWHDPQHHDMMQSGMNANGENMDSIWAETKMGDGKSYFYNTQTRQTTWERPEGPGVRIIRHEEFVNKQRMMDMMGEGDRGPGGPSHMPMPMHNPPSLMDLGHGSQMGRRPGDNMPPNSQSPGGILHRPPGPMQQGNMRPPMTQNMGPGNLMPGQHGPGQLQGPSQGAGQQMLGPPPSMLGPPPAMRPPGVGGPPRPGMQRPPLMVPNQASQNPFGKSDGSQMDAWNPSAAFTSPYIGNPNFGVPPASFGPGPGGFPVMPPQWNFPGGLPGPAGVPPPTDPILAQIDPKITAIAADWSEHVAPDGKKYYYNSKTQVSTWDKPAPLLDLDNAKLEVQQKQIVSNSQATVTASAVITAKKSDDTSQKPDDKKVKKSETKKVEKCRPVSSTPVSGTPWCVVWTGDKRVFFYNPATKTSVWERPPDLVGRVDVDEMTRSCPERAIAKVKRAEASSTTAVSPNANDKAVVVAGNAASETSQEPEKTTDTTENTEPPAKRTRTDSDDDVEIIEANGDEDKDTLKGLSVEEVEAKASQERATIPIEVRLNQFREMLVEKEVSAFSTWEKELHKIVYDKRYVLLTAAERKKAFDRYVEEIVEEEKQEKRNRFRMMKDRFFDFLTEIDVPLKITYNELSQKWSRDERFRSVEKSRDRESFFHEYMQLKRKRDKDERAYKKERDREKFFQLMSDKVTETHMPWIEAKRRLENDSRYQLVDAEDREECYKQFQKRLRHKFKRENREKHDKFMETYKAENGDLETCSGNVNENQQTEPISDEEEGCISDSDDEERERQERIEHSIREREKQVQLSRANQLKDIDKEREFCRHSEATEVYQAILTDLIKSSDLTWKEAKSLMKKDSRWPIVQALQRAELEDIYAQHCARILDKKKRLFKEMLIEQNVTTTTRWADLLKRIRDDPRFTKFSNSDRKCEREFENYLRDLNSTMKIDFRELLKETKLLNYKTFEVLKTNPNYKKEIESHLDNDKRYLQLNHIPEERDRLLREYLLDLASKGPPPPVTASEPSRRAQKT